MTQQECAELAAKYTMYLLYKFGVIHASSAEGCNLWTLLQEGMGHHDADPQVPLNEVVKYVKAQMDEGVST